MGMNKKSVGLTGTIGAAIVGLVVYAVKSPSVQSAFTTGKEDQSPWPTGTPPPSKPAIPTRPSPNVAPAGSLFLTKKLTVPLDSGPKTYPVGTLFQIKSRRGSTIIGTINGTPIGVDASAASSVAP